MDRKAIAAETLQILRQGCYEKDGARVGIFAARRASVEQSASVSTLPAANMGQALRRGEGAGRARGAMRLAPLGAAEFRGRFARVGFAVLDASREKCCYRAFARVF